MDLISSLKNLLGYWAVQATSSSGFVDNWIFVLHYKFTTAILAICCITVAINQFLFQPIKCMASSVPPQGLDTFCWMIKSFQMPFSWSEKDGLKGLYPGVTGDEPPTYHSYYQWVCFILLVQSIMFYIPGHFWKTMENNRIKKLTLGLDSPAIPEDTKKTNTKLIVQYFLSSISHNDRYFFYFLVAEVLNFVNVVGQAYLIDKAFDKVFSTHGMKVLEFTELESYKRNDSMIEMFPRVIRCTFRRYGASGTVQRHDAMCALPINEMNEKIYIFLLFWFIILAFMSGHALIYRLAVILSPTSRFYVTITRDTICNAVYLRNIVKKIGLGDWFVLDLLAKNMDPQHFNDIVHGVAKELDGDWPYNAKSYHPKKNFLNKELSRNWVLFK